MVEIKGAVHLHTTFSDGGVEYPGLIAAAQEVGLDYVVVTDHMTLRGKEEGFEGRHGNLLVLVGYEHHDAACKNHYLALGLKNVVSSSDPEQYVSRVKEQGGVGIIAHPMERRHYFKQYPPYPWTRWDVEGFDGIELWNQMSEWVENLRSWFSYARILYPRRFLAGIPPELKTKWDEYNRNSFISGIGGVDAHTLQVKLGPFSTEVFPIKVELKGVRTHLYFEQHPKETDVSEAKSQVIEALRDGRGFISNYRRGDATGTRIELFMADGTTALPGRAKGQATLPAKLSVRLPATAEIRLLRNGKQQDSKKSHRADFDIMSTGAYRIEAFRGKKAWIYSNPFPVGPYPL